MQPPTKRAVFFESVSTQRQADQGVSLETMREMAEDDAGRNDMVISETILEVILRPRPEPEYPTSLTFPLRRFKRLT
jgi:hypothetical protein